MRLIMLKIVKIHGYREIFFSIVVNFTTQPIFQALFFTVFPKKRTAQLYNFFKFDVDSRVKTNSG
jgi:hypothetical protein